MPRKRNGEMPLPEGWDIASDYDGKVYYIDHNNKKTTWIDPRDRFTKPQTFADCIGDELPLGWEQACNEQIGVYYINHVNQCTQLEDPRLEWRAVQEAMLRDYLQTAQDALEAKKEIYDIKQQRLNLAQDEYNHLNSVLSNLTTSRTSLCSSGSTASTKFDPDLLKSDVALAKSRVSRLKNEIEQIRTEMTCTQRGVDTLTSVEQKLSSHEGGCYNITEAQAILTEVQNIQKSLSSGQKEKAELMQSLAKLKDDLTRLQPSESTSDISTLSLPQEKFSTASQTDVSGELAPIGTRLAEMARKRLQYDEARKRIQDIQQRLADLEEKVQPGQVESDKDRLLLFQEKEQLLRELRSITPHTRSKQEMCDIQLECKRLEQDLNNALEMSNRAIADRLRLHEEKQLLLQQLRDSLRLMTQLESELKTLSASTLSVSSSSSLGSLSTTSSKGSLSSALSFTDIYGGPQCIGSINLDKPVDMVDLHKRVERLLKNSPSSDSTSSVMRSQMSLSPRSSLSSVSPPISPLYENTAPPPAYEQIDFQRQRQLLANSEYLHQTNELIRQRNPPLMAVNIFDTSYTGNMSQGSGLGRPRLSYDGPCIEPPLSPISEQPPQLVDDMLKVAALSRTASSSGTNTRSVSAAVSDESVAGDSGVFEASNKKRLSLHRSDGSQLDDMNLETAQIQIKLRYALDDTVLNVGIEKLRNLAALFVPENSQVYVKAALLPSTPMLSLATKPVKDLRKPAFGENFPLEVPISKLFTKTLQVNVWSIRHDATEDCLGCAQVSLADFSPDSTSVKWYNILSFRFMQPEPGTSATTKTVHEKQESDVSVYREKGAVVKEESSDESTIISSQTSTLTRNQDCEGFQAAINTKLEELSLKYYQEEEESESESESDDDQRYEELNDMMKDYLRHVDSDILEEEVEDEEKCEVDTLDKETNTECAFYPDQSKQKLAAVNGLSGPLATLSERSMFIKRSQTFSPSAVVTKNRYVCRLNRSDSDSAMPLYRRSGGPFQRNSIERRSLRWRRPSGSMGMLSKHDAGYSHHISTVTARTSIDLELDLQAQHTRLQILNDELLRLRELKQRLETAKEQGDTEVAAWVLEDEHFQKFIAQAESRKHANALEEKKVEKMLKKTSKEIYKLRKSKAGKGKPDVISFKEKMAFFTRVNTNIPVLPVDENRPDCGILKQDLLEFETEDVQNDGSPPRYEYVVDRVLGVEV